jgi:hypothetical protein
VDTPEHYELPEEEDEPPAEEGDDSKLADGGADQG